MTCLTPWADLSRPQCEGRWILGDTHLSLDVQDTTTAALSDLAHGHEGRAIVVPRELSVLDERLLAKEPRELVARDKVVVLAVLLTWSRIAGGVLSEAHGWWD